MATTAYRRVVRVYVYEAGVDLLYDVVEAETKVTLWTRVTKAEVTDLIARRRLVVVPAPAEAAAERIDRSGAWLLDED